MAVSKEAEKRVFFIERQCNSCGKEFTIFLGKKGKILSHVLYGGKFTFDIGMWSYVRGVFSEEKGLIGWERCQPWWKEFYYRFKDKIKLLLHLYTEIEYWECEECLKEVEKKFE